MFFEDSPICTKRRDENCPADCALLKFVPRNFSDEAAPCRYIPLNEAGETLHSMYNTATNEQIEAEVRSWLLSVIEVSEPGPPPTKASTVVKAA